MRLNIIECNLKIESRQYASVRQETPRSHLGRGAPDKQKSAALTYSAAATSAAAGLVTSAV